MAWDFAAQIHALTGFDADSTSDTDTGEDFNVMATQWLTDAAKEIINILPPNLLKFCTSEVSFTSAAVGSEDEILNTAKVLSVFAGNYEARQIPSTFKHKANDANAIEHATTTDPVFYIENSKINVLPASLTCKYEEVQYPTVTYDMSTITSILLTGVTATAADPTVFTKSSHGLVDGDIVKLSGFNEMTEINGMVGTVNQLNSSTFEVNGVAADPAETTGGRVEKVNGNFPDEAEYLVVLKAAITATEFQAAIEEDPELYLPIIQNLKQDYMQGLQAIGAMQSQPQPQPQQAGR